MDYTAFQQQHLENNIQKEALKQFCRTTTAESPFLYRGNPMPPTAEHEERCTQALLSPLYCISPLLSKQITGTVKLWAVLPKPPWISVTSEDDAYVCCLYIYLSPHNHLKLQLLTWRNATFIRATFLQQVYLACEALISSSHWANSEYPLRGFGKALLFKIWKL